MVLGLLWCLSAGALAQPAEAPGGEEPELTPAQFNEILRKELSWTDGPKTVKLGSHAEVEMPSGYSFIGRADTQKLMQLYGNDLTREEQGLIAPSNDLGGWFIIFEFDPVGYVKDEEEIDQAELLKSLKEGNAQGNKERIARGAPPLELIGWEVPPSYNAQTNNLEWCTKLSSEGEIILNHNIRLLGRRGVMSVTLVCDPGVFEEARSQTNMLLTHYNYVSGERYSEWVAGDKIAEYGLTALVAGGALAVAAKSGLLGKLIKPIIIGVLVVGGAIGSVFKKLFGRKQVA
jgi:uncharacterized membrane-anchored protein